MRNEELAAKMQDNDADRELLEELQETLQSECDKPIDERDFDLINEITTAITDITGANKLIQERKESEIARILRDAEQLKPKRRMIQVRWLFPIACAIIFLTSNILSYTVFGMNAFSAAMRITNGGIMISFKDSDADFQKDSDEYASEMLEICQKNGFTPLIPQYLPPEMKLDKEGGIVDVLDKSTNIKFGFSHKKQRITVTYFYSPEQSGDLEVGIPLHSYDYSTETICGINVNFFKVSNNEFRAVFKDSHVIYTIWTDGIDELETRKILYSMFSN